MAKLGYWQDKEVEGRTGDGRIFTFNISVCSECGKECESYEYNYCPYCGTKMEERLDG